MPSTSEPAREIAAAGPPAEDGHVFVGLLNVPEHVVDGTFNVSDTASDQFGWHLLGGAAVTGGVGVLDEDSTFTSRLSQTFQVPAGATSLRFTFHTEGFAADATGPPDAFEVALLDAGTGQPAAGVIQDLTGTDALLNVQADGTTYFGSQVTIAGISASGAVGDYSSRGRSSWT